MDRSGRLLAGIRDSGAYILGVGVHNAATARLVEHAGFGVLWLSSLEISTAKALPDANVITSVEVAEIAREIRRATRLPMIVDADNGYGSNETAVRAAQAFHAAGVAAMCIEDNAFPKRNSFYQGIDRQLEDAAAFGGRIRAIRRAVGDDRFEIIARTEALVAGLGVAEALERARAYVEAGADAIFVQTNTSTIAEFEWVLGEIHMFAPIVIAPTALPNVPAARLHGMGADVIIYSNVVIRTIAKALSQTLASLSEAQCLGPLYDDIASMEAIFELSGAYDWADLVEVPLEASTVAQGAGGE